MKFYTLLADGFETVEALGVVDILRRAGVNVCTLSINEDRTVTSSHKVPVVADDVLGNKELDDGDAIFIPGGLRGVDNLEADERILSLVKKYNSDGKYVIAICAGPRILGHCNILNGKTATCYPGFENDLYGASATGAKVEVSGNVITSRGMGTTINLGLRLVEIFFDKEKADSLSKTIQFS